MSQKIVQCQILFIIWVMHFEIFRTKHGQIFSGENIFQNYLAFHYY